MLRSFFYENEGTHCPLTRSQCKYTPIFIKKQENFKKNAPLTEEERKFYIATNATIEHCVAVRKAGKCTLQGSLLLRHQQLEDP